MRKKALSWILAVAMALSLFTAIPITASAAENSCRIVETEVEYATLDEALSAVLSGQTIQLLADISYESTIAAYTKSFTLDVNGHSLSVAATGTCIYAEGGSDLNITDGVIGGSVSLSTSDSSAVVGLYANGNGSTIAIDVPTSINIIGDYSYGVFANNGGEVSLIGDINVTGTFSYGAFADGTAVGSLITIDGEINSTNYVHVHLDSFSGPEQSITPSTKEGYYTFFDTDDTANPKSTVWVKAPIISEQYDAVINVVDGTGTGSGWTFASGEIWINEDGSYFISGGGIQTSNRVRVKTGVTAAVTLDNVNIAVNLPFEVGGTSNVTMILKDDSSNTFTSSAGHAGIRVQPSATLTISTEGQSSGNGMLTATGAPDTSSHWASAGIGGSELESSGTITINGGIIFANGGNGRPAGTWTGPGAAGIGGAQGRSCGDITINGGTVTAIGGNVNPDGAGIGGGSSDPSNFSGKIRITGGTVRAYSGQSGASGTGIGFCGTIAIANTADVEAYSSGNYPAIYGTTDISGHTACLLNFMLDSAALADTEITITRKDDAEDTFELVLPTGYKNLAATVETSNNYTAALSDGSKKIVSVPDEYTDFPGICDSPSTALSSTSVKLKVNPICMIGATEYDTLSDALSELTSGQTITLLDDISYSDRIWAGSSYYPSLNLDLNGYNLEISDVEVPIAALDGYDVHVTDSSLSGGGTLVLNTTSDDSAPTGITAVGTGSRVLVESNVTTTITATGNNSKGVSAYYGGSVEIGSGSITSDTYGIYTYGMSGDTAGLATFTGNVTALSDYGIGVYADNGGSAVVTGDITGPNIGHGVIAYSGTIEITGDVISSGNAATANGSGIVTVTGNAAAIGEYGDGAYAYGGGTVNITGNVTSSADGYCGAHAASGGSITVGGNVSETGTGGIGAYAYGYTGSGGAPGEITMEGSLTAENYILLETENGSTYKGLEDKTEPTTKTGYDTYSDGYNSLWVKIHTPPYATGVSIDGTADLGETLTGTYTFNSDDSLAENGTTFRWLRVSATSSLLGEPYLLFSTNNVGGVSSAAGGPPNPCIFTVTGATVIHKISNYHYGSGDDPGTISLRKSDGTVYGPWDAVLDGYWRVYPEITIPAGTYTVIDSKPNSWSYDYESNYAGMTEIVGYTIITGATGEHYTLQDSDSGKSMIFEVTPGDSSGHTGAAVKSNPFGPVSLLTENQAPVLTSDWNYSTVHFGQDYPFTVTVTDFENGPNAWLYSYIDSAVPSQAYHYTVVPGVATITLSPSEGVISAGSHTLNYYATDAGGATSAVLILSFTIEAPVSHDATLSGLSASGITLSPEFNSEITSYSASVANSVSSTTITATPNDDASEVAINGTSGSSNAVALSVGSNAIVVEITAGDGTTTETYTITIIRASSTGDGGSSTPTGRQITISTPDGGTAVTGALTGTDDQDRVTISAAQFGKLADADQGAVVPLPSATVTFDSKAIDAINGASSTGDAVLTVEKLDPSTLTPEQQKRVGDRPVYDFTLTKGSQEISNFDGGHAKISIPYTLQPGENPHQIVIYYLTDDGTLKPVKGHYDADSKCVVFETTHFSAYAVGYQPVSFSDVASDAWYKDAVDFIAAREITSGTGGGAFGPDAALTRGQFIVLLMNAYGIVPDTAPAETANFADAGSTYYTDYLLAAKSLGIVNGVGDNQFAPERAITRQEMFVMLHNALKVLGELPQASGDKQFSDFGDADQVAIWAQEAMSALVEGGVISGSNGMLNPTAFTSRAEMAQILYTLLSQ